MTASGALLVELLLCDDPFLQWYKERRYHVEFIVMLSVGSFILVVLCVLLAESGQFRQLVPLDLADFLSGSGREVGIHGNISEDI